MTKTTASQGVLKLKDAAKYLGGISQVTVRRLIKRGLIKPNRALRHILIPITELDRFVQEEDSSNTNSWHARGSEARHEP